MGRLILVILFYWVLLFENGPGIFSFQIDLGNGLEIRMSLILKFVLLLVNILILSYFNEKHSIPKYLLLISSFLFLSSLSVILINPSYFVNALAVFIHVLLMLNIILFIKFNSYSKKQVFIFYKYIRYFALINAMLVILSYFFPQMLSLFEIRGANTEMVRVFGIMDDEVSVFLSFFLFEALVFRRFIAFAIYLLAIFFTVGLGASFTVTLLLLYFLFFMIRKTKRNLYLMAFSFLFLVISATLFFRSITESALIQRIKNLPTEDKNNPLAKRLLSYQVAIEMIKERPLLGYGYGNYSQSVIQRYRPKFTDVKKDRFFDGSAKVIMSYTFNPFLQMTAEAGIIGLLVFIFFLYKMIHSVKLKIPDETSFEKKFNDASSIWLLIFVLSTLSANWFLPSSFLLLLVVSLVGINEKLKSLYLDEPAEEII